MTNKETLTELLGRVHPELDLSDDEVLFGRIFEDYEEYARLIDNYQEDLRKAEEAAEVRGRNAAIEAESVPQFATDGLPALGSGDPGSRRNGRNSIFDIAMGA